MAAKSKAAKAGTAAAAVKSSPYLQRLIEDESLRDDLRSAFDSSRVAFSRLNNGKAPHLALLDDKKLQKELHNTADALNSAQAAFREGPKKKRGGGLGKLLVLGVVGSIAAVALSEGLRNKLLDMLFGAEEEFDYQSTTAPATPPPPPAAEPAAASSAKDGDAA